jgi:hypothetical protein
VYLGGSTFANLAGPNAGSFDAWLARYDGAGNQLWIHQFGTSAMDEARAVAPDGSGGVYVCGETYGSLGGPFSGVVDGWFARYDGAGNRLWIRQLGTSTSDEAYAAAPDGSGGLYVGGYTMGSLGGPNAGSGDGWLARYDSAGNQTWIRQLGTSADDVVLFAAPDGSGGVYVDGDTTGSLGGPNAGQGDVWLARYDGAGNQLWIRQLGTAGMEYGWGGASSDGSGGVFLGGTTDGSLGGPNAGGDDAWFARYDSAGNQVWLHQFGTSTPDGAFGTAPDGSDGMYVSGTTSGTLAGPNSGSGDVFLARFGTEFSPFCFPGSDGVRACPCGNPPTAYGLGCNNFGPNPPGGTGGAQMSATGTATASTASTLVFHVTGMQTPSTLVVLFCGTNSLTAGVASGAGVRCVNQTITPRPYKTISGFNSGSVDFPSASVLPQGPGSDTWTRSGSPLPGTTMYYYANYRNPAAGNVPPCSPTTAFNETNAGAVTWTP